MSLTSQCRGGCLFTVLFFIVSGVNAAGKDIDTARVVIAGSEDGGAPVSKVVEITSSHLKELSLRVDVHILTEPVSTSDDWQKLGRVLYREEPGTLAVIGYQCEKKICRVVMVAPGEKLFVELQIPFFKRETSLVSVISKVAEELILGPYIPEIKKLTKDARNPKPHTSPADAWWIESNLNKPPSPPRSNLSLLFEAGYWGESPYPGGHPVHGGFVGINVSKKIFFLVFDSGWSGVTKSEKSQGKLLAHRIPFLLSPGLIFNLGSAKVSIAPVGRMDLTFLKVSPASGSQKKYKRLEIYAGGETKWFLPMPFGVDIVIGVGVLVAMRSRDYSFYDVNYLKANVLRVIWKIGILWDISP